MRCRHLGLVVFAVLLGLSLRARAAPEPIQPTTPRAAWRVRGSLAYGPERGACTLRLEKSPASAFSFTPDLSSVRILVKDHRGKPVSSPSVEAEEAPPAKDRERREAEQGTRRFRLQWDTSALPKEMYTVSASVRIEARADATGLPVYLPPVEVQGFRYFKTPEPDAPPALRPGQRFLFIPRYEPTAEDRRRQAEEIEARKAARKRWDARNAASYALAGLGLPTPDDFTREEPGMFGPPRFRPQYQMPYVDAETGAPVSMRDVALKVFTLVSVQPQPDSAPVLEFSVEGRAGNVRVCCGQDVEHLPHLTPIVEDDTVRSLRADYEGKQVWFHGGGGFECVAPMPREGGSFGTDAEIPYLVRRLVRLYTPNETLAIGNAPDYIGPRDSEFTFDDPVYAVVELPRGAALGAMSWSGFSVGEEDAKGEPKVPMTVADLDQLCLGTVVSFADAWDMERAISLQSPNATRRKWPARFRSAIAKGEIRKGMTPDMVVAVLGWPNEYGTPDEMRRWDDWRYDSTPPYNYWVNFKNGRVVSFGPDGRLP